MRASGGKVDAVVFLYAAARPTQPASTSGHAELFESLRMFLNLNM